MIRNTILILVTLPVLWFPLAQNAISAENPAHQATSLYLYNFLLFVDWPDPAFDNQKAIHIAVTGDDILFEQIKAAADKPIKGRPLIVQRFETSEDLPSPCHVVFIGEPKRGMADRIIERAKGHPILTVSDMASFIKIGGMVRFKKKECPTIRVPFPKRFEINLSTVKEAGLNIRSKLLRLSDIVHNQTRD